MTINRKQLILNAATKSFSVFGYKATTMDQVAKIANVGKGTIYTFFRNKEELFQEIVHRLIDEMKATAEEHFNSDASFIENVHTVIYKILEYRLDHQFMIKLFQEEREMGTLAVSNMVQQIERAILTYISTKVKLGIEKGEIKSCDPELTAFIILKMYISLIFDWEKKHEPLEKEEIANLFELYIFNGLSKHK